MAGLAETMDDLEAENETMRHRLEGLSEEVARLTAERDVAVATAEAETKRACSAEERGEALAIELALRVEEVEKGRQEREEVDSQLAARTREVFAPRSYRSVYPK